MPVIVGGVVIMSDLGARYTQEGVSANTVATLTATVASQADRMNRMQQTIQQLQIAQADTCQQFAKVETQFGTTETIINKDNIDALRDFDVLKAKVLGLAPSGVYYEIKIPHEVMPCVH